MKLIRWKNHDTGVELDNCTLTELNVLTTLTNLLIFMPNDTSKELLPRTGKTVLSWFVKREARI